MVVIDADKAFTRLGENRRIPSAKMWWAALVGAIWGVTLIFGVSALAGDTSMLVHFAPPNTNRALAPPDVVVQQAREGYDGQFYFRLARAPLSTEEWVDGVKLDGPALRMSRIAYPAAARVISMFGVPTATAMAMVNVAAFSFAGAAAAALAVRAGRTPWAGGVLLLTPSMTYGATMSITDTLAGALVITAIAALVGRHWTGAALAMGAAAITRESTLVIPTALLITALIGSRAGVGYDDRRRLAAVGLTPFAVAAVWQIVVYASWGSFGISGSGGHNLTWPFVGPFSADGFLDINDRTDVLNLITPTGIIVLVGVALYSLSRPSTTDTRYPPVFVIVSFVLAAILATMLGPPLLASYRNSARAMGEAALLAGVVTLWNRNVWSGLAATGLSAMGLVVIAWELRLAA